MSTTREAAESAESVDNSRTVWFAPSSRKYHTRRDCDAISATPKGDLLRATEETATEVMHDRGRLAPGPLGASMCQRCRNSEVPE